MPRYNTKFFDAAYYINANKDVAANWVGDVQEHFFNYGAKEGRLPASWFDFQYVRATNADLAGMTNEQLFQHYNTFGANEGRVTAAAYANFDAAKYLAAYSDLGAAGITAAAALSHYLAFGAAEGRTAVNKDGTAIVVNGTAASGSSYTLTTNIDTVTGTSGNDTIIGDNTGTADTATAGDQINGGAGTDTFKLYNKAATAIDTLAMPQLTSIESINLNNGTLTDAKTFDASAIAGLTSLTIDSPVAIVNGKSFTVKGGATQSLNLTKVNVAAGGAGTLNLDGMATVALNAVGADTTNTGALTLDLTSAGTTLALNATGAASKVTVANTGGSLATVTITGDQKLTLTESVDGIKTIDGSKATGALTVDVKGATLNSAFAFTGGSANDTLTIKAGALALLSSGAQLDGGAGTDTLVNLETGAVLTAAQVAKINATKGFEVLGFGANNSGVDISGLTSINSFKVASGNFTETFSNSLSTTTYTIDNKAGNSGTVTIGNKVGETATAVTIDGNGAGSAQTLAKIDVTGISNVTLTSSGVATKVGTANVLTDIVNSDNTSIVVKGDTDLTITTKLVATTVGSKVDASAFTGKLSVIGSDKADVLIGGTGADTLQGGAADKATGIANTMTGGAGADTFVFEGSDYAKSLKESAGTTAITKITDFVAGTDKIKLVDGVNGTNSIALATAQTISTAADLTAVYAGITAISASSATGAQNGVVVTVSAGAAAGTYLYINDATGGVTAADDMLINITGISGTLTANDFLFA